MAQQDSWKGIFSLYGFELTVGASRTDLYLSAAETNGESRFDLWPASLGVTHTSIRTGILEEVRTWTKHSGASFPLCAFMPDRLPDPALDAANKAAFRTISQKLTTTQSVILVQWTSVSPSSIPGAGLILFPSSRSHIVMSGALFLASNFPEEWLAASTIDPTSYSATGANQAYFLAPPTAPSSASGSTGSDASWPSADAGSGL